LAQKAGQRGGRLYYLPKYKALLESMATYGPLLNVPSNYR